jgi:hypothetical protein
LTARGRFPHMRGVSRPGGRSGRKPGEESPGSMETRCRITSGGGDPRESATETKPPWATGARVKRCGKSAPRTRQRGRQGKPHQEQNRIGATRMPQGIQACLQASRPGWLLEAVGNDCHRGMAATSGALRPGPYKTRLTGRLTLSSINSLSTGRFSPERRGKPLVCLRNINPN